MQTSEINDQIAHISRVFSRIVTQRTLLESKLFPVNAYICVGFYQTYHNLYGVMKKVWDRTTPEELAKRSKTLLSPIQALSISYLWLYYSLARMGTIYNKCGGDPSKELPQKREEWKWMLEQWYRLSTNYFNSGKPTVAASGYANTAFSEETVGFLKENLQPANEGMASKVRHVLGSVDLYAFIDECEARAKIVSHGPFPISGDQSIIVAEYTNLYDGRGKPWLPWSATDAKLPSSTLGVALSIKGAKATFNDIGTVTLEPGDYTKQVTGVYAYRQKNGGIETVSLDELSAYAEAADSAQAELYMKFAEMDRKQLLIAGAEAYWRCFARYTDIVGVTNEVDWGISQQVQEEYLPYFLNHDEDPAFTRLKMKVIKMKALPFLKERDPVMYYLPEP
jgi:hypothetical protein